MEKDFQLPNQQISMENCNVFMGPVDRGVFPLPGAHVTINQYSDKKGQAKQDIDGPVESADDRQARKEAAIKDMCRKLENLEEEMLGYYDDGKRMGYVQLTTLLRKALGMLEMGSKHEFIATQEGIWTILIDRRDKCVKDPKDSFYPQTFLNIIGCLRQKEIINGKVQDILDCLYAKPDASMRKCIERGIGTAFPEGTEEMLEFYINLLRQQRLV